MQKRGGAGGRGSADRGFLNPATSPSATEDHPFHSQKPRFVIYVFMGACAVVLMALLLAFTIVAMVKSINDRNRRHFYGANLDPLAGQLRCAGVMNSPSPAFISLHPPPSGRS